MIYIIYNVWATTEEPQPLSYPPYDHYTRDPKLAFAALPFQFMELYKGSRHPIVLPYYNGRSTMVPVEDVGPWNKYRPYWRDGTRPHAEMQHRNGLQADNGRIPNNPAGVDFSPEVWVQLGVDETKAYSMTFSAFVDLAIIEFDGTMGPELVA